MGLVKKKILYNYDSEMIQLYTCSYITEERLQSEIKIKNSLHLSELNKNCLPLEDYN